MPKKKNKNETPLTIEKDNIETNNPIYNSPEDILLQRFLKSGAQSSIRKLLWFLCKENKIMFFGFFTLYFRSFVAVLAPKAHSKMLGLVASGSTIPLIKHAFILTLVYSALYSFAKFLSGYVENKSVCAVDTTLANVIHIYISNQDAAYRAKISSVKVGVNITNLLKMSKIWSRLVKIMGLSVEIVISLIALFYYGNWIINSMILVNIFLYIILFTVIDKPHKRATVDNAKKWNMLTQNLINNFHFLNLVNIFNRQSRVLDNFISVRDQTMAARKHMLNIRLALITIIECSFLVVYYGSFAVIIMGIIKGTSSVAFLTLFGILIYRVNHFLKDILSEFKVFEDVSVLTEGLKNVFSSDLNQSIEYINKTLANKSSLSNEANFSLQIKNMVVGVKSLEEDTDKIQETIINIDNLSITQGARYVVVGPSGCGKSSLARVLVGLWKYNGNIILGNQELSTLSLNDLRKHITLIAQETELLPITIGENISYSCGYPVSQEKIAWAAKMACVDHIIENLPEKYDTVYGQNCALSVGEIQRIALARVFLSDAKIIILDESTSSLDVPTEMQIYNNLSKFAINKTLIIIAHRMGVLKYFDEVIFIENGSITAIGQHIELLSKNENYKNFLSHSY